MSTRCPGRYIVKRVIKTIISAALILSSAAAYANSGPVYMPEYPSSEIMAVDKNSPIEVINENLIFDFSGSAGRYLDSYECMVTAEYEMANPESEDLSVQMAFPFIERIGGLSEDNIKIRSDNEELDFEIYLGETVETNKADTENENYFQFEKIIGSISNDIYSAENFSQDEAGNLYSIEINTDNDIRIAADLNYDYEKTKILAGEFNGFSREGGKTRLTAWCRDSEVLYIYVLGHDVEFSISGYTDGGLSDKTDEFTYEISKKEIDVKTYLLDYIKNNPYISFENISDIQLYNVFAEAMDEQFTNNLGFAALDELLNYGSTNRMITLVYNVEFPKNSQKTVSVSYKTSGTMDRRNTKEPLYTYDYILNPAENWKDFKNLNIKIFPPEEAPYIVDSSIELTKEGNIYTAYLETLPQDDLQFTIYGKEKVTFMDKIEGEIDKKAGYALLFAPFILGLIIIVFIIYKLLKRSAAK